MNAGVGIESVDAIVFGCDVENIAELGIDCYGSEVERFGIDFAVDGKEADLAELSGGYVALSEDGFLWVKSVTRDIVVIGGNVWCAG